jgi:hypothetical protein
MEVEVSVADFNYRRLLSSWQVAPNRCPQPSNEEIVDAFYRVVQLNNLLCILSGSEKKSTPFYVESFIFVEYKVRELVRLGPR